MAKAMLVVSRAGGARTARRTDLRRASSSARVFDAAAARFCAMREHPSRRAWRGARVGRGRERLASRDRSSPASKAEPASRPRPPPDDCRPRATTKPPREQADPRSSTSKGNGGQRRRRRHRPRIRGLLTNRATATGFRSRRRLRSVRDHNRRDPFRRGQEPRRRATFIELASSNSLATSAATNEDLLAQIESARRSSTAACRSRTSADGQRPPGWSSQFASVERPGRCGDAEQS